MQFHQKNATGKAGERFVETFVEETLGLVYRQVKDPDIGIDGEIELVDSKGVGTGGFLKVQVKTTGASPTGKRLRIPLDEDHLDYFASLTVPLILAVVSLPEGKIWWKPILQKENYAGPKGGYGVTLDLQADEMTRYSASILRMIGNRSNAIIAKYLLEEVEERLADMDEGEAGGAWDYVTADSWAGSIRTLDRTMKDARCLLRYERRYSDEITAIERRFDKVRERLAARKSWFTENEVGELLTESRWGDED